MAAESLVEQLTEQVTDALDDGVSYILSEFSFEGMPDNDVYSDAAEAALSVASDFRVERVFVLHDSDRIAFGVVFWDDADDRHDWASGAGVSFPCPIPNVDWLRRQSALRPCLN